MNIAELIEELRELNPKDPDYAYEVETLFDAYAEEVSDRCYVEGYVEGRSEGYEDGYDDGYREGYSEGYDYGHSDGAESCKDP